MLSLALGSLNNRRFVAILTVLLVALSVALILGVERLRAEARESFANSASGIDLIVAAPGNPVQILLATIFGVGSTGAGLGWETFETVDARPEVAWAVPIQMGDNHKGFPVIGTTPAYFERFRHSGGQALAFAEGAPFMAGDADGAVVGAEVAVRFGYQPGTLIVNAHGAGAVAFDLHDEAPFTVTGVLAPTGTAVDRMVLVSLEGFDELHAGRRPTPLDPFLDTGAVGDGAAMDEVEHGDGHASESRHGDSEESHDNNGRDGHSDDAGHRQEPEMINAILVGLTNRAAALGLQQTFAESSGEAVTAVLPNVALLELWSITGTAEAALRLMAWAVALAGLVGMVVMLTATLETRRREFAVLRSVGATPGWIFGLMLTEAALLTAAGLVSGLVLLTAATWFADPILSSRFGMRMGFDLLGAREIGLMVAIFSAGIISALVPAVRVYRMTLADGLAQRL